jgi:glycosyltransferase involved in cell wall biosynthesis
MSMKSVSILLPAYNAEPWIRETIESALSQTWCEKEIIIVDDGSTDSTLQIAKGYQSKIVKVVVQENSGACRARNKAFELAQGDYIQWLDADDLLAPDKIEKQMLEAERVANPAILLTSSWAFFYARYQTARFSADSLWRDLSPIEWLMAKFSENLWMNPAPWLVSRKLADLAGPWDERLARDQDGEYICRVVSKSEGTKFVADARSYYRQSNPNSLSRALSEKASKSVFLGTTLSIGHLLALENSDRTRAAGVKLLQARLHYFYPEKQDLLRQVYDLARDLGGTLSPPRLSWKYLVIKSVFGQKAADRIKVVAWNMELRARAQHDRLLLTLSRK